MKFLKSSLKSLFLVFILCTTFIQYSNAQSIIIPVYVHDFEGHAEYTDISIINLICKLNSNFAYGGTCPPTYTPSDIRFALQEITRDPPPSGGSGLTPAGLLYAVGAKGPNDALHIYLYDFGGVGGVYAGKGAFLGGSGWRNAIMLHKLGYNDITLTHETAHYLGLDHVGSVPTTLNNAFAGTCPGVSTANDLGPLWPTNYMVETTSSSSCFFSFNQIALMRCTYEKTLKPSVSIVAALLSKYAALAAGQYNMPAYIKLGNSGTGTYWADFIRPTGCLTYFDNYTYSIEYCTAPAYSPHDIYNQPTTGVHIPIPACASGIITCITHHSGLTNKTTQYFNTMTPGCSPYTYCTFSGTSKMAPKESLDPLKPSEIVDKTYIYPTVSNSIINVISSIEFESYTISDMAGKLIQTNQYSSNIDINNLPTGNYIMRLNSSKTTKLFRFTKN